MADTKDDILRKALEGKLATDDSLTAEQEHLRDKTLPSRFPTGTRRSLISSGGDIRFVGNVTDYALYSPSQPTYHPRRHRRLIQEHLFYGADVYAEGTSGRAVNSGGTDVFKTEGVDVEAVLTVTGLAASDLILVVTQPAASPTASLAVYVFGITSVTGDEISVNAPSQLSGLTTLGYWWQVILPNPVEMLPYPDDDGRLGQEKTYFAIKPASWPTPFYNSAASINFNLTSSELTSSEKVRATYTHTNSGQYLEVGDFVVNDSVVWKEDGDDLFYVSEIESFTAGSPNTEIAILTPFFETDIATLDLFTLRRMYSVGDLLPFGDLDASPFTNNYSGSSRNAKPLFDEIRVQNLVGPGDADPAYDKPSGAFLTVTPDADSFTNPGYRLTLYPATAGGAPDIANPITNLSNIVIDSSIDEKQNVFVDYRNGAVRLSHPIGSNSDLNPNGYTDAFGRAKLFATFIAYNDKAAPVAAQELAHRNRWLVDQPGANTGRIRFTEGEDNSQDLVPYASPIEKDKSWIFEFPAGVIEDLYHRSPLGDVKGGKDEKFAVRGTGSSSTKRGVEERFQYRSDTSGFFRLGAFFYGHGDDERTSRFVFYPDAANDPTLGYDADKETQVFGAENQPEFRITYDQIFADTNYESSWSAISVGSNDTLRFVINDIPVEITLADGSTFTASTLASALTTEINNAASALGVMTGTFSVTAENDGTGDFVRILADSNLYFHDGNGHSNFQLPSDEGISSDGIRLQYGYDGSVVNEILWNRTEQELVFNGTDIKLLSGVSFVDHENRITTNETDISTNETDISVLRSEYDFSASRPNSVEQGSLTSGWLDSLSDGASFIEPTTKWHRGEVIAQRLLPETNDTNRKVAADGNGNIFLYYFDDSTGQYNIGKAKLDTNSGFSSSSSVTFITEATNVGNYEFFDCNGPYLVLGSGNVFKTYSATDLSQLGSYNTTSPDHNIVGLIIRNEFVFILEEYDGGASASYTVRVHFITGPSAPAISQTVLTRSSGGTIPAADLFFTGDNDRVYFGYIGSSGSSYFVDAYNVAEDAIDLAAQATFADALTGEVPTTLLADGNSLYVFGDLQDSAGAATIRRLDRDCNTIKTEDPITGSATSTFGVVDHQYIYMDMSDTSNLYVLDKYTLDHIATFEAFGNAVQDFSAEGSFLVTAESNAVSQHVFRILASGDRGGLWLKGESEAPTFTWRTALYGK